MLCVPVFCVHTFGKANRRFVSLGEEAAALRRDVEVWRGRAQDAERLVGAANASSEKLGVRLKEAYAENDSLAAAAAEVIHQTLGLRFAPTTEEDKCRARAVVCPMPFDTTQVA